MTVSVSKLSKSRSKDPVKRAADRLGLAEALVRELIRAGFVHPEQGAGGELSFSFQDLVLLREAQKLAAQDIRVPKIRRSLEALRSRLPEGKPLSGVALAAAGRAVVVRDQGKAWNPESGQGVIDFAAPAPAQSDAPPAPVAARLLGARPAAAPIADDALFEQACALEETEPGRAMELYRRLIAAAPDHADAHVNLGRLLQVAGQPREAEGHYRTALALRPQDATAAFNLGTALEDQRRHDDAIQAYARAVTLDPHCADAHYNLAGLYEKTGHKAEAIRHLKSARSARGIRPL